MSVSNKDDANRFIYKMIETLYEERRQAGILLEKEPCKTDLKARILFKRLVDADLRCIELESYLLKSKPSCVTVTQQNV